MIISIVAAVGKNLEIGLNNKLLWHIPEDFKHFKALTLGKTLLMGRKTFESIGKPLPGRKTIVITRDEAFRADGVSVAHSIEQGVELAKESGESELVISGGAEIYKQMIDKCDILHISEIDYEGKADTFFPKYQNIGYEEDFTKEYLATDGRPAWRYIRLQRS